MIPKVVNIGRRRTDGSKAEEVYSEQVNEIIETLTVMEKYDLVTQANTSEKNRLGADNLVEKSDHSLRSQMLNIGPGCSGLI